jgi:hypothetical protein
MPDVNPPIPKFNSRFVCIINRKEQILAAIISSYLQMKDEYLSMFEFPNALIAKPEAASIELNEFQLSTSRADEFAIHCFNAVQKIANCEYLILGGLTDEQKSYLYFLKDYNVIDIDNGTNVDTRLHGIAGKEKYLEVKTSDVIRSLKFAFSQNLMIKINDQATELKAELEALTGIIIVEDHEAVSTVIGINYAYAINCDVLVVSPPDTNRYQIKTLIENWKVNKDDNAFDELTASLYNKIENIPFESYTFATFLTVCSPYSLILANLIPLTFVNLNLRPDFFIFNNIYTYGRKAISSAIVFSPLEFGVDEETAYVIKNLQKKSFLVTELVGKTATAFALENHIKEFPFDLLHICSHGGEVSGTRCVEQFKCSTGETHEIVYDHVVSFAPDSSEELIPVTVKYVFRKFDGLVWKSKELKDKKYPQHIFSDMLNELRERKVKGTKISAVEGSCAIKCSDFNFQGLFNSIAGYLCNPIVFNNTCWSWSEISDGFLYSGCTGYLGTLWAVDNKVAVDFAEEFYSTLMNDTVLNTYHKALSKTKNTSSEDIYIFWGLHFSFFEKGTSVKETRMSIASRLLDSFNHWNRKAKLTSDSKSKRQLGSLAKWNYTQLKTRFWKEFTALFFLSMLSK